MLNNLTGWHVLIILGVLLVPALIIVGIVVLVKAVSKTPSRPAASPAPAPDTDPVEQIRQLSELHASGAITDAEFEDKRADLLGRI